MTRNNEEALGAFDNTINYEEQSALLLLKKRFKTAANLTQVKDEH